MTLTKFPLSPFLFLLNIIIIIRVTRYLNLDEIPTKITPIYVIKAILTSCIFGALWGICFRVAKK